VIEKYRKRSKIATGMWIVSIPVLVAFAMGGHREVFKLAVQFSAMSFLVACAFSLMSKGRSLKWLLLLLLLPLLPLTLILYWRLEDRSISLGSNETAMTLKSTDVIVLSEECLSSADTRAPIERNIDFVNALFGELLRPEEISHEALLSYYVDYYLAQVNNGGFAQFVYNTGWKPNVVGFVKDGLIAIGASNHAALFEKGERLVSMQHSNLERFLRSDFSGTNSDRDQFNSVNEPFYKIEKNESLEALNAAWLKSRPNLCVVPEADLPRELKKRASLIADREARISQARAAEPIYMKRIRALCDATGHVLQTVTAGRPTNDSQGRRIISWHFITDKGHHFMVEADGKAMMFQGKTNEPIGFIEVGQAA
jgi:hypothetical protein